MQAILDQIAAIVRPTLRKYMAAEQTLTDGLATNDPAAVGNARQEVILAARQGADVLHHLSDFILKEPSPGLAFTKIEDVRKAVAAKCTYNGTSVPVADVDLLRDVADAFKHHRPDRHSAGLNRRRPHRQRVG